MIENITLQKSKTLKFASDSLMFFNYFFQVGHEGIQPFDLSKGFYESGWIFFAVDRWAGEGQWEVGHFVPSAKRVSPITPFIPLSLNSHNRRVNGLSFN